VSKHATEAANIVAKYKLCITGYKSIKNTRFIKGFNKESEFSKEDV
jgi:hypothetical protein